MAPRKTPKPILEKLYATLVKVVNDPVTREQMERQGGEPLTSTPAEFLKLIDAEHALRRGNTDREAQGGVSVGVSGVEGKALSLCSFFTRHLLDTRAAVELRLMNSGIA